MTNPAGANVQLLGVPSSDLAEMLANVLKNLGTKTALVVHGEGFDEISTTGKTLVCELKESKINTYYIQPEDFGIKRTTLNNLQGADIDKNAKILMRVLEGEKGAYRDIVLLNSGALFYIAGKAKNIKEGIKIAEALMLNVNSAATVGVVTSLKKEKIECNLKLPVCADTGARVTISRRLDNRWRLIGFGIIKD